MVLPGTAPCIEPRRRAATLLLIGSQEALSGSQAPHSDVTGQGSFVDPAALDLSTWSRAAVSGLAVEIDFRSVVSSGFQPAWKQRLRARLRKFREWVRIPGQGERDSWMKLNRIPG